jgi:hypothetical protein
MFKKVNQYLRHFQAQGFFLSTRRHAPAKFNSLLAIARYAHGFCFNFSFLIFNLSCLVFSHPAGRAKRQFVATLMSMKPARARLRTRSFYFIRHASDPHMHRERDSEIIPGCFLTQPHSESSANCSG